MNNTFEKMGLEPNLLKALEEMGFTSPMPIQKEVIPKFLKKPTDLIGLAQTGTGKTAAYGLPLIQLADVSSKVTQGLILCPTRELCIQIENDLQNFARYNSKLRITSVYGGASIERQIKILAKGVHLIVATPGRMLDLLKRKKVDISNLDYVVLDEADEILNIGFHEELKGILELTPEDKKTLLFSATMSKEIAAIASAYMKDPIEIIIGKRNIGAENVRHVYFLVNARQRYPALKRIADINPDIYGIIFCRTRNETKEIAEKLMNDGYNADALHGDLSQAQREYVMKRFHKKHLQMLVATDIAARGLDVRDLTHIINYNLPDEIESYTHRSGRTGRAGKTGTSIAIILSKEQRKLAAIERIINKKFERELIPSGSDVCERQLFHLIDKVQNVSINEKQIKKYLPKIYEKLESLNREEIIKQFVSLEFNRFFDYYKDAPDLNEVGRKWDKKSREKGGKGNLSRFFINLGSKSNLVPLKLISMINEKLKARIDIGQIEIMKKFSFFEVDANYEDQLIAAFAKSRYSGKKIVVEKAEIDKKKFETHQRGRTSRRGSTPDRDSIPKKPKRKKRKNSIY